MAASPAAAAPQTLLPSGPWHLDYAPDSCTLARTFGKGDNAVRISFEQFEPGHLFDLSFSGKPFRSDQLYRPVKLAFGPGQPLRPVKSALTGTTTTDGVSLPLLIVGSTTFTDLADGDDKGKPPPSVDERAISEVSLVQQAGADFVLKLGPMDKPMEQMRLCLDELMTHWGLDPAKQRALTRRAKPLGSPGRWLMTYDYPNKLLLLGESAVVRFRLTVSHEGRTTGCAIQKAVGGADFAKKSCELLQRRARFEPALDAQGAPVASYFVGAVRWLVSEP